jgi:pectate lyase
MKKILFSTLTGITILIITTSFYAQGGPIGWAVYNDLGQNGTTGGGNGSFVRVTTKADLENYATATEPYTLLVEGSFTGSGMVEVASDKSIIGVGNGAVFDGFGINVNGGKNIIIRNLTIKNAAPDAIAIRNTHHVWIDHCDLSASDDGLLDFTRGSDYLTVSWTKFHDHDKTALVNSGTQHFEDVGKNNVTYHHNWFDHTTQRNPRIGYGMGHVFNNYYTDVSSYCVGYHTGASVLVENNYFLNSASPLNQMYDPVPTKAAYANARETGNIFENTSGNTSGTGLSFDPGFYYDYMFALDSAKDIPDLVQSFAGPIPGIEYTIFPTPGNGSIDVHTSADSLIWTSLDSIISWDVYFGTSDTSLIKTNTFERSFSPDSLEPGTEYYWKVDGIRPDTTVEGPVWRFKTAPAKASKPYPADGDLHAHLRRISSEKTCSPVRLSWKPGFRASAYKVYFGETQTLTEFDFKEEVISPTFTPGPLKYGVTYYWRVTTITTDGTVTEGDTWSFQSDIAYSDTGITEIENMVLNGRAFLEAQDGGWFQASNNMAVSGEAGPGTMSSIWTGADSNYTISVRYFDESDGTGWYGFYLNEDKMDEWFASANDNTLKTRTIDDIPLTLGDELRLAFYTHEGELNRSDFIRITVYEDQTQSIHPVNKSVYPPNHELIVSIYSITGNLLKSYIVKSDENGMLQEFRFDDQHLPSGIYIYTIQGKNIPQKGGKVLIQNNGHY